MSTLFSSNQRSTKSRRRCVVGASTVVVHLCWVRASLSSTGAHASPPPPRLRRCCVPLFSARCGDDTQQQGSAERRCSVGESSAVRTTAHCALSRLRDNASPHWRMPRQHAAADLSTLRNAGGSRSTARRRTPMRHSRNDSCTAPRLRMPKPTRPQRLGEQDGETVRNRSMRTNLRCPHRSPTWSCVASRREARRGGAGGDAQSSVGQVSRRRSQTTDSCLSCPLSLQTRCLTPLRRICPSRPDHKEQETAYGRWRPHRNSETCTRRWGDPFPLHSAALDRTRIRIRVSASISSKSSSIASSLRRRAKSKPRL